MSTYSIYGEKTIDIRTEAIKMYSQTLTWNDHALVSTGAASLTTIGPASTDVLLWSHNGTPQVITPAQLFTRYSVTFVSP